jgi:SAM-dependent methyltransferase
MPPHELRAPNHYLASCEADLERGLGNGSPPAFLTETLAHLASPRVLDIGCGIGQSLLLLSAFGGASGVGMDVWEQALVTGRTFQQKHLPHASVNFVLGRAESLPFPNASFDVVLFRLALPYADNAQALTEVARVLAPKGIADLRIHHLRHYLWQFRQALFSLDFPSLSHALRVLVSGLLYHVTGRQPRLRGFTETFQTRWKLDKELARYGMVVVRELSDSTLYAPDFLIRKV